MAKLKEIEVALGVTVEQNGVYYKPNARAVIELDEKDTPENRARIWSHAWRMIEEQVSEQLKSLK